MVDLLGHARKLQKAYDLTQTMPMKLDSIVWRTQLEDCSFHGNGKLAENALESLFKLEL